MAARAWMDARTAARANRRRASWPRSTRARRCLSSSRVRLHVSRARQAPLVGTAAAEAIEQEVDDRRREQREDLTRDQAADDRDAERLPQLGAFAEADRERQRA